MPFTPVSACDGPTVLGVVATTCPVPAAVPSLFQSSARSAPPWKKNTVRPTAVSSHASPVGWIGAAGGLTLASRSVPAAVPSLRKSARPSAESAATKKTVPSATARLTGLPATSWVLRSLTRYGAWASAGEPSNRPAQAKSPVSHRRPGCDMAALRRSPPSRLYSPCGGPVKEENDPGARLPNHVDQVESVGTIVNSTRMSVLDLKKQLVDVCHRASERWLTSGSGGNISIRIPGGDRYLCTATGVTFRDTAVENVVEMDLAGKQYGGDWKPSKEYRWHAGVFATCP